MQKISQFYELAFNQAPISLSSDSVCRFGFAFLSTTDYVAQNMVLWKALNIQETFFDILSMTSVFESSIVCQLSSQHNTVLPHA
jgi:hypothetical protein